MTTLPPTPAPNCTGCGQFYSRQRSQPCSVHKAKCLDCGLAIEPERLRWFAEKKGIKVDTCDACGFARRAARSQTQR